MALDPSRTFHADQAFQLSELVALKFLTKRYGTTPPRVLRLAQPDGPSTDGGRKARQAILLSPEKGEGDNIVCGFLDLVKGSAELRTYAVVSEQFRARHGYGLDITAEEYERLIAELEEFLRAQAVDVISAQIGPRAASLARGGPGRPPPAIEPTRAPVVESADTSWVMVLAALGLGVLIGFVLCYLTLVPRG